MRKLAAYAHAKHTEIIIQTFWELAATPVRKMEMRSLRFGVR